MPAPKGNHNTLGKHWKVKNTSNFDTISLKIKLYTNNELKELISQQKNQFDRFKEIMIEFSSQDFIQIFKCI